jgi:hypothetical protein
MLQLLGGRNKKQVKIMGRTPRAVKERIAVISKMASVECSKIPPNASASSAETKTTTGQ